jgi:hypothetical protein
MTVDSLRTVESIKGALEKPLTVVSLEIDAYATRGLPGPGRRRRDFGDL